MSTEQERAEFEAWHAGKYWAPLFDDELGRFIPAVVQNRWEAYQAGRAALRLQGQAEQALAELVDKIIPGLDTGDLLADAQRASAAMQSQPIDWKDPFERLKNPLTPYGLLVRALRIVADTTLMEMSKAVCATPAQLSSMEFGRTQPTDEMICFVHRFFHDKGLSVPLDLFRQANQARRIEGADDA